MEWHDKTPIYRQLEDILRAQILDQSVAEGELLPSVRTLAAQYLLNPITVSKSLQALVDAGLTETRRGMGIAVLSGARDRLLEQERQRFLQEEWPQTLARISSLGIPTAQLIADLKGKKS
jgi:GntR family transcriptional regulator